jgi:hypothetical protein
MKSFAIIVAVLVIMGLSLGAMMSASQQDQITPAEKTGDLPRKTPSVVEPDPGTIVSVAQGITVDNSVVATLRNAQVNQARLDYYADLATHKRIRIVGWDCKITDTVVDGGSTFYTLYVRPLVESKEGGAVFVMDSIDEQYVLKDGTLTFVKKLRGNKQHSYMIWF